MGSIDVFQRIPAPGTLRQRETMARQAHEAATSRLRPVMMTVVSTIGGLVTATILALQLRTGRYPPGRPRGGADSRTDLSALRMIE